MKPEVPPLLPAVAERRRTQRRLVFKWIAVSILGFIVFVGGIFGLVEFLLRSSDPMKEAVRCVSASEKASSTLGSPIEVGWLVMGEIHFVNDSGWADLSIPLSGPKGDGDVIVEATKTEGVWTYKRMELTVTATGAVIDLRANEVKPWHEKTTVASLSRDEVAAIDGKLSGMRFPVPRGSVEQLLPKGMIPDHVSVYEANDPTIGLDADGCGGGEVLDYWLNSESVLRLAIGYYPRSEVGYKDAWAVVIRSKDRETFRSTPFGPAPKINKALID